jgi:hypothetical protein
MHWQSEARAGACPEFSNPFGFTVEVDEREMEAQGDRGYNIWRAYMHK